MSMYSMEDIARFVEGDMAGEELIRFEEALKTDVQLQSDLAYYQQVDSSLRINLREDEQDKAFKLSLTEISTSYFKKEAKVIPMRRYIAWSSAIAAVFVLFMIWAPWHKDLYQQYAATEMIAMAERGDNAQTDMQQAETAFNNKNFGEAKTALAKVLKAEPDNAMAQYYYAITLLETGEIKQARSLFNNLYTGTSILKYDAAFYMGLSFLKEKDELKTAEWLEKIPADASVYDKAQELLNKLN